MEDFDQVVVGGVTASGLSRGCRTWIKCQQVNPCTRHLLQESLTSFSSTAHTRSLSEIYFEGERAVRFAYFCRGILDKRNKFCSVRFIMTSTNYKEAFSLYDKRGNGRVALESLGDLLRACGQNPTLSEIRELEKTVGGDFDFDSFSKILNRPGGFRDPGEPEEYCRGFQVFDKDMTGFIGVGQLRYILTNLGEKMSDEEVDELLKAVDTSSGEINYMELVRTILAN